MSGSDQSTHLTESFGDMPLFHGLSVDETDTVLAGTTAVSFEAGAAILEEGAPGSALYLVEEGTVDVSKKTDRGAQKIARLEAKTIFGEMGLVSGKPGSARVVAVTPVRARVLTRQQLLDLVDSGAPAAAKVLLNVAMVLAGRLSYLDELFVRMVSKSSSHASTSEIDGFRASLFSDWNF